MPSHTSLFSDRISLICLTLLLMVIYTIIRFNSRTKSRETNSQSALVCDDVESQSAMQDHTPVHVVSEPIYEHLDAYYDFAPQNKRKEGWTIVGFTNKRYLQVALTWHAQLVSLGYNNHKVCAIDKKTFEALEAMDIHKDQYFYGAGAEHINYG